MRYAGSMKTRAQEMVELLKDFYPLEPVAPFSTKATDKVDALRPRELRDPKSPHLKRQARAAVAVAKRRRELIVGDCSLCGDEPRMSRDGSRLLMHAHHEDYARPLDIVWVCWRCHAKAHTHSV